ncbi:MAG: SDR family oxidoreductase [Actinomycetota bacterium]
MPEPPEYPASHHLLEGKAVLVTAAAGAGIGFATARRCAEEGATVVISDKHEQRLKDAAAQIAELSENYPVTMPCDVTKEDEVQRLFDTAERELARPLDVVVNNAGLGLTKDIVDMTDEEWQAVLDVTLTATMRCTRQAMRRMIARGSGVIVNNASIIGWRAQAGQAAYAAAKAGVMALTRTAAIEGAPHGVRVNAVSPSLAIHPFLSKVMPEETLRELIDLEAFKRSAETWEVANVIVFLASHYSSYMTGEVVSVSSQHP